MPNNHKAQGNNSHIVGFKTYVAILAGLLGLTVLTVLTAQWDWGRLNEPVAWLIATVKAGLVLLYFMHLKYEERIYGLIFGAGVFFVVVLYLFSQFDVVTRVIQESVL